MDMKFKPDLSFGGGDSAPDWQGESPPILALRAAIAQMAAARAGRMSLRELRHVAERETITRALREHQGQVPAAAASLGISRAQLYRLIGRFRLELHAPAISKAREALTAEA
jgi:DNA-binding NtrC family response regulator